MNQNNPNLPCNPKVFQEGKSLLAVDTFGVGSSGYEDWVQLIAKESGQLVDWYYSGGVAHTIYIGDRTKILETIIYNPCPCRIMRVYEDKDPGLFRNGVTEAPEGAIAGFYDGGPGMSYTVEEKDENE